MEEHPASSAGHGLQRGLLAGDRLAVLIERQRIRLWGRDRDFAPPARRAESAVPPWVSATMTITEMATGTAHLRCPYGGLLPKGLTRCWIQPIQGRVDQHQYFALGADRRRTLAVVSTGFLDNFDPLPLSVESEPGYHPLARVREHHLAIAWGTWRGVTGSAVDQALVLFIQRIITNQIPLPEFRSIPGAQAIQPGGQ